MEENNDRCWRSMPMVLGALRFSASRCAVLRLAVQVIPKTLAVNAAKDATELVAKLRAYHYTAQVRLRVLKF